MYIVTDKNGHKGLATYNSLEEAQSRTGYGLTDSRIFYVNVHTKEVREIDPEIGFAMDQFTTTRRKK